MSDRFFTVTHLDGSTRTYDHRGVPAYSLYAKSETCHIDIRPEPTQASGCAAANDAWNHGGQQAWLDLNIQAHVKTPSASFYDTPLRRSHWPKWMRDANTAGWMLANGAPSAAREFRKKVRSVRYPIVGYCPECTRGFTDEERGLPACPGCGIS